MHVAIPHAIPQLICEHPADRPRLETIWLLCLQAQHAEDLLSPVHNPPGCTQIPAKQGIAIATLPAKLGSNASRRPLLSQSQAQKRVLRKWDAFLAGELPDVAAGAVEVRLACSKSACCFRLLCSGQRQCYVLVSMQDEVSSRIDRVGSAEKRCYSLLITNALAAAHTSFAVA